MPTNKEKGAWAKTQAINRRKKMKNGIHPENYRLCVFKDMGTGDQFITKSCADAKDTIEVEGVEYPLIKMEISSYSHPFYTGKVKLVDTAGRVDKFRTRYGKK
ncbi:MAG: 50S ribosomal protein L31 type B [Cryomorphaceae bacterium]|nr:MAG: 50S ribosomal protein L31 type B [Cryomorphaceae bacterium]